MTIRDKPMTNKYIFTFVQEVTSRVEVEARDGDEARDKIEEGNFTNQEVLDTNQYFRHYLR